MTMPRRTKLALHGLACGLAIAITATACGGGADTAISTGTSEIDRNGALRMVWTLGPDNLDPHQSSNYQLDFNYLAPVYDRLTMAVADARIAPMLAESWSPADDGMSIDFTLRTDAVFHDGRPVDADAVVRSLNRARDPQQAKSASSLSMIADVQEIDDRTVRIRTTRPSVDLLSALSSTTAAIVNPVALDNHTDLSTTTAGSGPYVPDNIRRGDRIIYSRADNYWDPEAQKVATLEIIGMPDNNARINTFRSGNADVIQTNARQTIDLEPLLSNPRYALHAFNLAQFYAIQLDIGQPGLDDPRVRRALNYAIDREAISASLLNGKCTPTSQPLAPGVDGHNPDVDGLYNYDPEKARALLAEAGAPEDLTIQMIHVAGLPLNQEIATVLQAQLGEVGVKVNLLSVPAGDAQITMSSGDYALLNPRLAFATPAQTLQTNYLDPLRFPTAPSAEFQGAVERSLDPTITSEERTELYSRASTIAAEEAYDVFICGVPTLVAYDTKVVGVEKSGQADFAGIVDTRYMGVTS